MPETTVSFELNGRKVSVTALPFRRLLDVLREEMGLTGSKEGCGEGECGACSVLLNDELVNSCIIPVIQAEGATVLTVEAVRETAVGAAVQAAFCEHGGSQCGICTPGMVMTAWWLSRRGDRLPDGAREGGKPDLRQLMAGNLCRCTGYELILRSVEAALAAGNTDAAADHPKATRAQEPNS
jgi:aerobic carbon-monoxide dehydrogenase small subunit